MNNVWRSTATESDDAAAAVGAEAARWWFTSLDERSFTAGAQRWLTRVVGIHPDRRDLWIQAELVGDQIRSFIVHVGPATTLNEVLARIETLVEESVVLTAGPRVLSARPSR